jgi:hypothetical protein
MSIQVPKPVAIYLAADGGDSEAFSQGFAEDTVVRDEGQTYRGLAAIKRWKAEAKRNTSTRSSRLRPLTRTEKPCSPAV